MSQDFLLNFAAKIDISGLTIASGVKSAIAALGKSGSIKPIKQKIEFDTSGISKATNAAASLIEGLSKTVSKTRISPSFILNQKEITEAAGQLALVETSIKGINAAMAGIKLNREMIPNAGEQLGKLFLLKNALKSIESDAKKVVKIQLSPDLEPVRKFDVEIINAGVHAEQLNKNLQKLKDVKLATVSRMGTASQARDASLSGIKGSIGAVGLSKEQRMQNLQSAREEASRTKDELERAKIAARASKPGVKEIENAEKSVITKGRLTISTKEKFDEASASHIKNLGGTDRNIFKEALDKAISVKNQAEKNILDQKGAEVLEKPSSRKALASKEKGLQSAIELSAKAELALENENLARSKKRAILERAKVAADAAYDLKAKAFDAENTGKKNITKRNSALAEEKTKKDFASKAISSFDEDTSKVTGLINDRAAGVSLVKEAEKQLILARETLLAKAKLKVLDHEIKLEQDAINIATKAYAENVTAAEKSIEKLKQSWVSASNAQDEAKIKLQDLRDRKSQDLPSSIQATKNVESKQKAHSEAEARVRFFETSGVDESLFQARSEERRASKAFSTAQSREVSSTELDDRTKLAQESSSQASEMANKSLAVLNKERSSNGEILNQIREKIRLEKESIASASEKIKFSQQNVDNNDSIKDSLERISILEKEISAHDENRTRILNKAKIDAQKASDELAKTKQSFKQTLEAPAGSSPTELIGTSLAALKQSVDEERKIHSENSKILAGLDLQESKTISVLSVEKERLATAKALASENFKKSQSSSVSDKQSKFDAASARTKELSARVRDQESSEKEELKQLFDENVSAKQALENLRSKFFNAGKGKSREKKDELQKILENSPEAEKASRAESRLFSNSFQPRQSSKTSVDLAAAKQAEGLAKSELDTAKSLTLEKEESQFVTEATASGLLKIQNLEENLRAIQNQKNESAINAEQKKTEAIIRRANAEKVLNAALENRVVESKKDLEVEKNVKGVVTDISKIFIEANSLRRKEDFLQKQIGKPDVSDENKQILTKELSDVSNRRKGLETQVKEKTSSEAKRFAQEEIGKAANRSKEQDVVLKSSVDRDLASSVELDTIKNRLDEEKKILQILQLQAKESDKRKTIVDINQQIQGSQTKIIQLEKELNIAQSVGLRTVSALEEKWKIAKQESESASSKLVKLNELKRTAFSSKEEKETVVTQAKINLEAARQKKEDAESASKKSGGVEVARASLAKALNERRSAEEEVSRIDKEILSTEQSIVRIQENQVSLEKQQSEAAKSLQGNLQKDVDLRKQIFKLVERTVQEEKNLQARVGKSLSRVGIEPNFPPARERALERLKNAGVTEADIEKPDEGVLQRIKEARPNIASQRSEEIVSSLSKLDQSERARVVRQRLSDLDKSQGKTFSVLQKTSPKDDLEAAKASKARESRKNIFGEGKDERVLDSASLSETVIILRAVNAEIRNEKDTLRQVSEEHRATIKNQTESLALEKLINNEIREEGKQRSKIKQEFAKQGIGFDVNTGVATSTSANGRISSSQVFPSGSLREIALKRLGISEMEATPDKSTKPTVESVNITTRTLALASKNSVRASEERRQESISVKEGITKDVNVNETIKTVEKLISRQLDLEKRRASATGTTARDASAVSRDVLGKNIGKGVATIDQAKEKLKSGGIDEQVAARNRLAASIASQNKAMVEQGRLEQSMSARAKENSGHISALNKLIDQTTRALEEQARAVNRLARSGVRDATGRAIRPIEVNQGQLRDSARAMVLGDQKDADLSRMDTSHLSSLRSSAGGRVESQQAVIRQFNDDIKAVTAGSKSGFEIIARYGDSTFERLGGKVGQATEKLAAYAFSGIGLYGVISQTRQAMVETALLEKEITNLEQIFDSTGSASDKESMSESFKTATESALNTKKAILDISSVTGKSAVSIAQASKTLAAAGFSSGAPGFEETIRAVSFAELGPSFGNTEAIIDGLIAATNQFNLTLGESTYVLGLVNEYSKAYAVESQDLFEAIKRGGGAFAAVGGNLEDFIKLVTVAREQTRESASVIGTSLKTLAPRLFTKKAENVLGYLGIDVKENIDPMKRIYALAKAYKNLNVGASGTQILSQIVDSRSVGRLAALLDSLPDFMEEFETRSQDITNRAAGSITRDAIKRFDDIGVALDRVKTNYFKLVESLYNNPATKSLLRIINGIGNIASDGASLGVGEFKVGNFANPLIQAFLATGIVTVIRGAVTAYKQNNATVKLNTDALNTLRVTIDTLRTSLVTSGVLAGGGPGSTLIAATGGPGKEKRGLLSKMTGLSNPLMTLGIASLVPGLVNSILPYTNAEKDTQDTTSSVVTGGVLGGVGAAALAVTGWGLVAAIVGGAIIAGFGALSDQRARDLEIEKSIKQEEVGRRVNKARQSITTGIIPEEGVDIPILGDETVEFVKTIRSSGEKKDVEELRYLRRRLVGLEKSRGTKMPDQILMTPGGGNVFIPGATAPEEKGRRASLDEASKQVQEFINRTFLRQASTAEADTVASRKEAIDIVSVEISKQLEVQDISFDPKLIKESLERTFLDIKIDKKTGAKSFSESLSALSISLESLSSSAESAGKIVSSLGNALTNVFKQQTIQIQSVASGFKSSTSNFETFRSLLASPFKSAQIQQIPQEPTGENSESAVKAIESITGIKTTRVDSSETRKAEKIINGFFREFQLAERPEQERLLNSFDPKNIESIGQITASLSEDTEQRGKSGKADGFPTRGGKLKRIENDFNLLNDLGPFSKKLLDIIKSGAEGSLPFDITKIGEMLQSGDINSASKLLGIEEARVAQIALANSLISQQNDNMEQQLKAAEALVAAHQDAVKSEIALSQSWADSITSVNNLRTTVGIMSQTQASEHNANSQRFAAQQNQALVTNDVSGRGDTINLLKELQIALASEFSRNSPSKENVPTNDVPVDQDFSRKQRDAISAARSAGVPGVIIGENENDTLANVRFIKEEIKTALSKLDSGENTATVAFNKALQSLDSFDVVLSERVKNSKLRQDASGQSSLEQSNIISLLDAAREGVRKAEVAQAFDSTDSVKLAANVAITRQILENELQNFETIATQTFKALSQQVDVIGSKIQSQKSALDSIVGKSFTGSGPEQAAAQAIMQRASQNFESIVKEVMVLRPDLKTLGPNQIFADPDIARIVQSRLSTMGSMDVSAMREFLTSAGSATFTQSGISGEQGLEMIRSAYANLAARISGLNISQSAIGATISEATRIVTEARNVSNQLEKARIELDKIVIKNAEVMTREAENLTKAIAAIPKQINIVISGIDNINVGFDLTNVEKSMKEVGDAVFNKITGRLKELFTKNNLPALDL